MISIAQRFTKLKQDGRLALMPFLMAGDPDLATTRDVLLALQRAGADMVELGMPYSDPLADGPVIQAAAARALTAGTSPSRVLEMLTIYTTVSVSMPKWSAQAINASIN